MKRILVTLLMSGALLAGQAGAQAVDAASDLGKFRNYRDAGMKALDHNDSNAAMANFMKAGEIVPDSPSILLLKVQVAQKQGKLKDARAFLTEYLDRGYVLDLKKYGDFHQFWDDALEARNRQNRSETGELRVVSSSPDFAITEGIAYAPETTQFFVSGVRTGTVTALTTAGAHDLIKFRPGVAAYGLGLHAGKLWATTAASPQTLKFDAKTAVPSKIVVIDPANGQVAQTIVDPSKSRKFAHLLLGADDLYVADSEHGEILRLNAYQGDLQTLIPEGYMDTPDALAEREDGKALMVADYISGLYRVDLATGEMKHIVPPADASLLGISFMTRYGNDLVAIQTGFNPDKVLRLHMSDDWAEVKSVDVVLRSDTQMSQPTQGVIDGDSFVFVAKSQWDALDGQGNATKTPGNAVIAALKIGQ